MNLQARIETTIFVRARTSERRLGHSVVLGVEMVDDLVTSICGLRIGRQLLQSVDNTKGNQWKLTIASGVKVRAPPSPPTWMSIILADTVEARTKPTNGMNMAGKFVCAFGNKKTQKMLKDES